MTREPPARTQDRFGLRDVPGTALAVASLAILGAAAVVATPVWLWYRHKRKRADALAGEPPPPEVTAEPPTPAATSERAPRAVTPAEPASSPARSPERKGVR